MNEITLKFQEGEVNALLQIIDIAVKAQGLAIADTGLFLANKIKTQGAPQVEKLEEAPAEE